VRGRRLAAAAAMFISALAAAQATAAPPDAPTACRVERPAGLWPTDYVDIGTGPWDTHLHHGLNSNWNDHTRPIGTVRAVMIMVDFSDRPSTGAPANQNGRDWREAQPYLDWLKPGLDFFKTASNGRFDLQVDVVPKWYRMSSPSTNPEYGMTRNTWTIERQQAYMREAVAKADPDVDFSPYNLVFIMPPRGASGIEFSPELNFYQEPLRLDGKVIRNGVTYGQDMFQSWGYKIINHEAGHDISFPESYNGGSGTTHQWIGGWDVMGDILGGAPDYMSWNKWKVGWLDDFDFGCLASDGSAEYNLSTTELPSDGGLTKKGVVVRTSATTAIVAELREPRGNDVTYVAPAGVPGSSRMCDWGVLVYKLDVTKLNSYGSIQVVDNQPLSTAWGCTRDVDIATLGKGQGDGPARYEDPDSGTVIEVQKINDEAGTATLKVTRAINRVTGTTSGVAPLTTTLTATGPGPYSWDDGQTTATVQRTFGVGTHTVSAGNGATTTVKVYAPATGTPTLTGPANADTGTTANLTAALAQQDLTVEAYRAGTKVASGTNALAYSSPIAATDTIVACAAAGSTCLATGTTLSPDNSNLKTVPTAIKTVTWRAGKTAELWDGITTSGWSYAGTGSTARNGMTALQGAGGSATNAGVLYTEKEYKDFELSVDYRGAATSSNGGVLLRFPKPATMADADRNGYQVAILDNGTAATRTGAITQERPALSYATSSATTFKPTREWNTLNITAIGGQITVRLNGVQVSQYSDAARRSGYIGLENAGTGVMYRNITVKDLDRTDTGGGAGGTVPATLALSLGAPAGFGAFVPGVAKTYTATTTATVTSTAGDAALTFGGPDHLSNGAFSLPQALQVVGAPKSWSGPVSNDVSTLEFRQAIGATDALRTGSYSTTLTFTLSTTNP